MKHYDTKDFTSGASPSSTAHPKERSFRLWPRVLGGLALVVRLVAGCGGWALSQSLKGLSSGSRLFDREEAGERALDALLKATRKLIRNGATANRKGLLGAIRAEGLDDTRSPKFDGDIPRLRDLSQAEVVRLTRHSGLPILGGIPIPRDCMESLRDSVERGSLLVTGEPGSGKTGVLVALAEAKIASAAPIAPSIVSPASRQPTISEPNSK
jgi:hypothetical protein